LLTSGCAPRIATVPAAVTQPAASVAEVAPTTTQPAETRPQTAQAARPIDFELYAAARHGDRSAVERFKPVLGSESPSWGQSAFHHLSRAFPPAGFRAHSCSPFARRGGCAAVMVAEGSPAVKSEVSKPAGPTQRPLAADPPVAESSSRDRYGCRRMPHREA